MLERSPKPAGSPASLSVHFRPKPELARLARVARREPTAVLGVVAYWLGTDLPEGIRRDCN